MVFSKPLRRIQSVWFPYLPTDRLQRAAARKAFVNSPPERAKRERPLVVAAKAGNMLQLSAVSPEASALGLVIGQPLANARAMLPEIQVATADPPADLKMLGHLADWCDRFTPLVALDAPHGLLLDVSGTSRLFGGERELLGKLCQGLQAQGFAVQSAIAGTAAAARAFARFRHGSIIPPGEEAAMIAPLPITALFLDPTTIQAFRRAGLKTVRQAASRKRSEITARFGAATLAAIDEALGHRSRPISPRLPPPDDWQEKAFPEPVATEDVIRATLKDLAAALSKTLEQHGRGARRMEAAFFRADGAVRRIAVEMGEATRDPGVIDRLFGQKLAALADPLNPGFGFDLIRLSVSRAERSRLETASLDEDTHAEREAGFLIDRLSARFGAERILVFQPNDTHIPEEAWKAVPAQHAQRLGQSWEKIRQTGDAPRRPLRLFGRPEPMDAPALLPGSSHFIWRKVQRMTAAIEGPERIAMEWWHQDTAQPERDYFRIEDKEGRRYWLYRSGEPPRWFLHGIFA